MTYRDATHLRRFMLHLVPSFLIPSGGRGSDQDKTISFISSVKGKGMNEINIELSSTIKIFQIIITFGFNLINLMIVALILMI